MSEYQRFLADNGEAKRYDYPLSKNSLVWDVGGYKGEFAEEIYRRYGCNIVIYEPVFYKDLQIKFKDTDIVVLDFGLSDKDEIKDISVINDSSSFHKEADIKKKVHVKDVCKFIHEVDLIKINIEGDEYRLLQRMLDSGKIKLFKNIQVQFHKFVPFADDRMDTIQKRLSETHELTYQYKFIWENWMLKCTE